MTTNIGLDAGGKKEIASALNVYVANLHVLYTKLHNFHWNLEGHSFFTVHAKLEEMYDGVAESIDEFAERILMLGERPLASMKDYLATAKLAELPSKKYASDDIINALLEDFRKIAEDLRGVVKLAQKHGDEGTADMAIGELQKYEKSIWMLSAYLG